MAATSLQKYTVKEALNKLMNDAEDALKVDIDNVTLTTEGADVAIDVALDNANDSVLIYSNTAKDGTGTNYVPLIDADGHSQVDVLTMPTVTITDGGGTISIDDGGGNISIDDGGNSITVDGTVTANAGTNLNTSALALETGGNLATVAGAVSGNEMQVDVVASLPAGDNNIGNVDIVSAIPAGSNIIGQMRITDGTETANVDSSNNLNVVETNSTAIKTAVETIDNAISGNEMQVDVVASLPAGSNTLGSMKLTDGVETANVNTSNELEVRETNSSGIKTAIETLLFTTGKDDHVNSDAADIIGAPYYAIYVGTGGNLRLNTASGGGGADLTLNNVASGQIVPIEVHRVYSTSTTASGLVFLK